MKRISIYDGFDALPASFEEVFSGSDSTSFFSTLPWFRHLAETVFSPSSRLRIYGLKATSSAEEFSLVLPMCQNISGTGKISCRKLTALSNYYTPFFSPIGKDRSPCTQADLNALAVAIAAERPRWDIVDLHPLDTRNALFDGLLAAFRNAGMLAASYYCFGNWYLEVKKRSFREYHASLPSRLRNTLRRKTARLTDAGRLQIDILADESLLDEGIAAFEQVYKASWKKPEPYPHFIPGLIRTCARHGWLRLGIATIDNVPAAAQIWIVCNGVASIYKLAYDERFAAESVGSILTARLMEHVIDIDRVRQVDFLSGDDPYKKDWMSHRRERRGIIAFNLRTACGLLGALRHVGGRFRRRLMRRGG